MKKLFAIILSAMLILTMCTATAFAIDQNVTLEEVDGRPEITEAGTYILTGTLDGQIYAFLDDFTGDRVCSKLLYAEALGNTNQPQPWETREICEIMNTGIANGTIKGWRADKTIRRFDKYGKQRCWERYSLQEQDVSLVADSADDFTEIPLSELDLPFG